MSNAKFELTTKENLTVQEFNELYEAVVAQVNKDLEVIKGLAQDETYNPVINIDYYDRREDFSTDLQGMDPDEMIEAIQEWKEYIKQYEGFKGFYTCQESDLSGDYEDEYAELDSFHFRVQWLVPKSEINETTINNQFKEMVRHWLAPEDTDNWKIQYVDCKLLTLFKDGKIDWQTLRTLVYSDCGL